MMQKRVLGSTGLDVSVLGLGTVKIGRNQQVKYPSGFELPDDRSVIELFELARSLGINLIDTAPAYGSSEQRLGELLPDRHDWVMMTKVCGGICGKTIEIVITGAVPIARFPRVQLTVPAFPLQLQPEPVAFINIVPGGNGSETMTLLAVYGPMLFTIN